MLLCQRQKSKFYTGGKTTGIGYITAVAGFTTVQFGQAVYEVVVLALYSIVHREVYNLQFVGQGVALEELACIAVRCTEEEQINLLKRHFGGKG